MDQATKRALALNKEGKHMKYIARKRNTSTHRQARWEIEEDCAIVIRESARQIHQLDHGVPVTHHPRQSQRAQCGREFETGNTGGTLSWTPTGVKIKSSGRSDCKGQSRHESLMRGALDQNVVEEAERTIAEGGDTNDGKMHVKTELMD